MQPNSRNVLKQTFLDAEKALQSIGCEVKRTTRVHNKMLAIDDDWLIEGSFNWLSSVRNEQSSFQYRDVSVIYRGPDVAAYIQKERALYGLEY